MKKRAAICIIMTMAMVSLSACDGMTIPDMTQQQETLVAEYAAGLLMKYDPLFDNTLMTDDQLAKASEKERIQKEREERTRQLAEQYLEKTKASQEKSSKKDKSKDTTKENKGSGPESISADSIGSFLGLDGLTVSYDGYRTLKSYPETGNNVFSVDAANGKELVVTNVKVTNPSDQAVDVDMFSSGTKFVLMLADGTTVSSSSTLLLDDFSIYKDKIEAGATVNTILLFEVNEGTSLSGAGVGIMTSDKQGVITVE